MHYAFGDSSSGDLENLVDNKYQINALQHAAEIAIQESDPRVLECQRKCKERSKSKYQNKRKNKSKSKRKDMTKRNSDISNQPTKVTLGMYFKNTNL